MSDKPKLTCRMFGFAHHDIKLAEDLLEQTPRLGQHVEFDHAASLDLVDLVIINESVEELSAAWQKIQARRSSEGLVLPDVLYVRDDADALLPRPCDSLETGNIKRTTQRAEFFSQQDFSYSLSSWVFDWLTTFYSKAGVQTDSGARASLRLVA